MTDVTHIKAGSDATARADSETDPVAVKDRIESLDVIRGFAVLGILVMNMVIFHQPYFSLMIPTLVGPLPETDITVWFWTILVFDGAMRALFCMLFGAGIYLFFDRLEARSGPDTARRLHIRRTGWLIGFGLLDAYLFLWIGDVLFVYGLMGLLLWTIRGASVRTLLGLAALFALISFGIKYSDKQATDQLIRDQARIEASRSEDDTLSATDQNRAEEILAELQFSRPPMQQLRQEAETIASGYVGAASIYWPINMLLQTIFFIAFTLWDTGLCMLIGMALMKSGGLSGAWSLRTYAGLSAAGFAIALPIRAWALTSLEASGFDLGVQMLVQLPFDQHRTALAVGYLGLIICLVKLGWMPLQTSLRAVGQMALTNYLMQSLIGLTVFVLAGHYGSWSRLDLLLFTFAVWAAQLLLSPLWLRYFRYGPAEWLWRSLTYRASQPLWRS